RRPQPDKLVLVTPSPPITLGEVVAPPGALDRVGLAEPYRGQPPAEGQCRLDLAGDLHHYARYAPAPGDSYAAVVSGGGGAFAHPTSPERADAPARAASPPPAESRRAFARALFDPRTNFRGGIFNVFAFIVAAVICGGSFFPGTRAAADTLLRLL